MTEDIKPTFATNRPEEGECVADKIASHLQYLTTWGQKPWSISIATAYINPEGFVLIEKVLRKMSRVRLLIGAEPRPPIAQIRSLENEDDRNGTMKALEGHERLMEEDRNLLGFGIEADNATKRLVDWLNDDKVEVRRFTRGFLHGKAYLVDTDDEGVIAGSSNFTSAGLTKNHELNLGLYHPTDVALVRRWFDDMWNRSEPYDLSGIYGSRFKPHSPYLIYLRMLWEKYGREVEALAEASEFGIHLPAFGRDGVTLAQMILARYHGVVIADGVGLGKTYLAGELIRQTVEERRQRALVIAPAALRDGMWQTFRSRHLFHFDIVSYDDISADPQLNPNYSQPRPSFSHRVNEYALVVIDEAHSFRNPATQRAAALSRLLEGSPPKQLVMLTATPVNNSLWDLYNLLTYFIRNDAEFATVGIPSLRKRFQQAAAIDPDDLNPDHLYDVLSPVVVRRTRSYVKHYYPNEEIEIRGEKRRISFPIPEVRAVNYDLSTVLPGFLDRFAMAIDVAEEEGLKEDEGRKLVLGISDRRAGGEEVLTFARYAPSAYRLGNDGFNTYEGQVAGLLRSSLLKRFESSAHAFANTCKTMAESHDDFLHLLDEGWVATGEALTELATSDSDEIDELIVNHSENWKASPVEEYDVTRLKADVQGDRDLLREWAHMAASVSQKNDPKLKALVEELAQILKDAHEDVTETSREEDRRKVIIFSYFADTVEWMHSYLADAVVTDPRIAPYTGRVVAVAGSDREADQRRAMFGFAPVTTEAPPGTEDEFDILISTDVLAEGVNLQQARNVINFDLPWNPMRLAQRHGRVDRIGSPHSKVWISCVMPDKQLDQLLQLEDRLHRKIKAAAHSIGVEGQIIPGSEVSDLTYVTETRETIEEIRRGETTFLEVEPGGASVEEYRQQLREGIENSFLRAEVEKLAWGSGSGKAVSGASLGFVFCAKVADSLDPHFCYVGYDDPEHPVVVSDALSCLRHAYATEGTERVLEELTYRRAYDAWRLAKDSIFKSWQWSTDPAHLQPTVPKVMRDAAELVRLHPPAGYDQAQVDRLYDTLNAPYAERVRRQIREALTTGETSAQKVAGIVEVAERLALRPRPAPKPLPLIEPDDIHLICWMAIVPAPECAPTELTIAE